MSDFIECPECGSTTLNVGNKGFGRKGAVVGGILHDPIGTLRWLMGSKNVIFTCLRCGHKWELGKA